MTRNLIKFHPDVWNWFENTYEQLNSISKSLFPENEPKHSFPKYEIIEYSDRMVYEIHVPGLNKEDIQISYQKDEDFSDNFQPFPVILLNIRGKKTRKEDDGKIVCSSLYKRAFQISFRINAKLFDENTITSSLEEGVLKIVIQKFNPEVKNKIKEPEIKTIEIQ